MTETLSSSIATLLKSKGEMTAVQIELELEKNKAEVGNALTYLVRSGKVFYRKGAVGNFSVRNIYYVSKGL